MYMKYNCPSFATKDKDSLSFEFLFGVELHFNPNFKPSVLDLVWHRDLSTDMERVTAGSSVDVLLPQHHKSYIASTMLGMLRCKKGCVCVVEAREQSNSGSHCGTRKDSGSIFLHCKGKLTTLPVWI